MITVHIVETFPRPTPRERLFALQGEKFTREVRREAEIILCQLQDDFSPEVEAMRAVLDDAASLTESLRAREDEERRAGESSVMIALLYRGTCRACGR